MRLEIANGGYFIIKEISSENIFEFQSWLFHHGFEGKIESRQTYMVQQPRPYFYLENPYDPYYNPYDPYNNPRYIENRQEIGYLLNYRYIRTYYDNNYKTELIKIGMCIIATGSHLLFLDPGEYEILPAGLKILPNE